MPNRILTSILCTLFFGFLGAIGHASPADTPRPFMLWTPQEAQAIRQLIENEPWAQSARDEMLAATGWGQTHRNLFKYQILGDKPAGETEKEYLLSFIGAPVNERPWSDNYLHALRYDLFYDQLTDEQKKQLQETFRVHIRHEIDNDRRNYQRDNWLPNMQWPRKNGAMLMAVALQDEKLIREIFACNGGWKYYFDDYLADGRFYNEEFGKQYSNIGEMLLWCRGLERLGLDELGYGYVGKHGATMRRYLESYFYLGMPRVDLGTERFHYPRVTMGDAKSGWIGYGFQHAIVQGYLKHGAGGNRPWMGANMNGRDHKDRVVEKMLEPMWFEIAHVKWPDAHFDYFLAQMRRPDQELYIPSLMWGCAPIDPKKVKPPAAPSGVYPQRGMVVLRADESPAFWESPAPALSLRLATPYVHSVRDEFSITGFYAFNRPIYVNRQVSGGYAGTDPGWSNSIRSHSGVFVDNAEPSAVGEVPTRHHFSEQAKFVLARGQEIYPQVDQSRALVLTRDYLFDVFSLISPRPRSYQWQVQTLGTACPDNPDAWASTRHLIGSVYDLSDEQSSITDDRWSVTATQITAGADPELSGLGERWFDSENRVGVKVTMLGEPGTIAYMARGPVTAGDKDRLNEGAAEPGGLVIAATRTARATMFAALHEPFKKSHRVAQMRLIQKTEDAIAVAIIGTPESGINDRIAIRFGDKAEEPITLTDGTESLTFKGYAYARLAGDQAEVQGELSDAILINGKSIITIGKPAAAAPAPDQRATEAAALSDGPIATRWSTDVVRLPIGGEGQATLNLRNIGLTPVKTTVQLLAPQGMRLEPAEIEVDLPPGTERTANIAIRLSSDLPSQLHSINLAPGTPKTAVQNTPLRVAHGVVAERSQLWPRDFAMTIYAPRYVTKHYYLTNVTASVVRDGTGLRRSGLNASVPERRRPVKDERGRDVWQVDKTGGFQAFQPAVRKSADGAGRFLADMGEHPHGYRSAFEYRFTEDWIIVRVKDGKPEERVVLNWANNGRYPGSSEELLRSQKPEISLVWVDGKVTALDKVKPGTAVRALFRRPAGFDQGELTLYPENSRIESIDAKAGVAMVSQQADAYNAFTFATEAEMEPMVQKWLDQRDFPPIRPWQQGEMGRGEE